MVATILEFLQKIGDTQIKTKVRELTHYPDRGIRIRALEILQTLSHEVDSKRKIFNQLIESALGDESEMAEETVAKLKKQPL